MRRPRLVTNANAPIATALAVSTGLRRGIAASVTRISPRRYSEVRNIALTTATAISPMNTPARLCSTVTVGHGLPGDPGDHRRDIAGSGHGGHATGVLEAVAGAICDPRNRTAAAHCGSVHPPPDATPVTATWSTTPVTCLGPPVEHDPPNDVDVRV